MSATNGRLNGSVVSVVASTDTGELRNEIAQQPDALAAEFGVHGGEAGDVATRLIQALDESGLQWRTRHHHNWDGLRGRHSGSHRRRKMSDDDGNVAANKLDGKLSGAITSPIGIAELNL